ncbi:MAG TPA: putative DNA modification/repair radical SAM protein [Nitrospiria bacterium]|jgi:putative DNA modification/repair radical SAM protein|nr:putative DNA modification/repair radical SAM protein [Nitrospiria bacterium]
MDILQKLAILGEGAAREHELSAGQSAPACFTPQSGTRPDDRYLRHRNPVLKGAARHLPGGIHVSPVGGGKTVRLLKVLQTNICEFDCFYCEHRAGRDVPRTYVSPEELARTFMMLHRKRFVDGLFLSSGITRKVDTMQERMIQTAEILRTRHQFKGYIHLKILPGASQAAVEQTFRIASRVSLNLEAPTPQHLSRLSARKNFLDDMLTRMVWVKRLKQQYPDRIPAGQITQFVVGAAGETDLDLLAATGRLYGEIGLRRAYFSAFSPVPDTPLDHLSPAPLQRQHRLYQADWLLRFYGFSVPELIFDDRGHLPTAVDPKTAWALGHPEFFPLEVLRSDYEKLLRVPGIGPISAKRIAELRRSAVLTDPRQLTRLGVVMKRAAPYLLLHGRPLTPASSRIKPVQLDLWSPEPI